MKRILFLILMILLAINLSGCNIKTEEAKKSPTSTNLTEQKVYHLPVEKIKNHYTSQDFTSFYSEYLKLNNQGLETAKESKTGMSEEQKTKYYRIFDITPEKIRKEVGCQIFKVNNTCETYVINKGELFKIGFGFGGFGIITLETCNFDKDKQTDLIYSFSWGSGLHRSQIGIYNFTDKQETWLNFSHLNEDITLEKLAEDSFNVFNCELKFKEELNYTQYEIVPKKIVGKVIPKNGSIEVNVMRDTL